MSETWDWLSLAKSIFSKYFAFRFSAFFRSNSTFSHESNPLVLDDFLKTDFLSGTHVYSLYIIQA